MFSSSQIQIWQAREHKEPYSTLSIYHELMNGKMFCIVHVTIKKQMHRSPPSSKKMWPFSASYHGFAVLSSLFGFKPNIDFTDTMYF